MTVSTSYEPIEVAGNGVTTAIPVTWQFLSGTLVVTLVSALGVKTVKTITTHYTVSGGTSANGTPTTGTVTMVTAPAVGETLRIERVTPRVQSTTYANNDGFPAKTVEAAFDRCILVSQEMHYLGGTAHDDAVAAAASAVEAETSADEAAEQSAAAIAALASAVAVTGTLPRMARSAIKALDTNTITTAYCTEAGREGMFNFRSGNYASLIAADTAEGIYLKANAVSASVGAWVRDYEEEPKYTWFGATSSDISVALDAMIALGMKTIILPAGSYQLPNGYAKTGVNNVTIASAGAYGSSTIVIGGDNTGFHLTTCSFWRFSGVSVTRASGSTAGDAFLFDGASSSNTIEFSYIAGHKGRGIAFVGTSGAQQSGNDVLNSIIVDNDGGGIHYVYSHDNKIVGNEIGKVSSVTYPTFGVKLDHSSEGQLSLNMMWDNVQDVVLDTCADVGIVGGRIELAWQEGIYGTGCTDIMISSVRLHTHSKSSSGTYDAVKFVSSTGIGIVANNFRTWNATQVAYSVNLDTATANASRIVGNMFKGYATAPYTLGSGTGCIVAGNDPIDAWNTIGTRTRLGSSTLTIQTPAATTDVVMDVNNLSTASFAGIQQTYRVGSGVARVVRLAQRDGASSGGQDIVQTANSSGSIVTALVLSSSQEWLPGADNTQNIGSAALRMATIYAGTGTINTSDRNAKENIRALSEAETRVAVACKGLLRAFQFKDAVAEKGDAARVHFGVIAQDVMAAFSAEGLDANRYGLLCLDQWDEQPEVKNEETGDIIIAHRPAGQRYGIRYEELLCFLMGAL